MRRVFSARCAITRVLADRPYLIIIDIKFEKLMSFAMCILNQNTYACVDKTEKSKNK